MTTNQLHPPPPCNGTSCAGRRLVLAALLLGLSSSCAYRPFVGPLVPLDDQAPRRTVPDDGRVVYLLDRVEVRVRPMSDAELNRQFADASRDGARSTNAYTYGDLQFSGPDSIRSRFAVFHVAIKNYSFPKVRVDPSRAVLEAGNEREYYSLALRQVENYYRAYARGYEGNEYARHRRRPRGNARRRIGDRRDRRTGLGIRA